MSALIGLIAFFTGGAVAGMTSAIRGAGSGLLNVFMVWALGTVLILLLSALEFSQLFGAPGNVAGQVGPGALRNAANSAQANAPNVSPQEAVQAIRTLSLWPFSGCSYRPSLRPSGDCWVDGARTPSDVRPTSAPSGSAGKRTRPPPPGGEHRGRYFAKRGIAGSITTRDPLPGAAFGRPRLLERADQGGRGGN